MKKAEVLPNLLTIGNALCGFAAIVFTAGNDPQKWWASDPAKFWIAAWLILAAMLFDAVDGKVARMAKASTDFGAQLDSLCDMVSFGVAPAFLVKAISMEKALLPHQGFYPKIIWVFAALYVACAALRLARFNVETAPDEESHRWFKGLPSPAAAATVSAIVILYYSLEGDFQLGRLSSQWPLGLPVIAAILGGLMVSEVPYPHLLVHVFRGRKPFASIAWGFIAGAVLLIFHQHAIVLGALAYVLSGPVILLRRRLLGSGPATPVWPQTREDDEADEDEPQ